MPDPIDIHVGSRVRMARTMAGMGQDALAEQLDLTFQQIQKYEKGHNRISASRLMRIAAILNKRPEWFFDEMPPELEESAKPDAPAKIKYLPDDSLQRETLDFIRNLSRIDSEEKRALMINMVKTLTTEDA